MNWVTMNHPIYNGYIDLNNRRLWCDGDISVDPSHLSDFILKYKVDRLYTTKLTPEVIEYNKFVTTDKKITVKGIESLHLPVDEWLLPASYKHINLSDYIFEKLYEQCDELADDDINIRIKRVQHELKVFIKHDLSELLQTLIYIVDEFNKNNIVWGVGRGSSVSSYILFLIGIHDIDSVEYELDFSEFLQ